MMMLIRRLSSVMEKKKEKGCRVLDEQVSLATYYIFPRVSRILAIRGWPALAHVWREMVADNF
ncbi:hypothetical protein NC651_010542 [Populus alba x Populus x berolinensis]|nr:hypothetical protein NC651_010542 [Populus alba x Populus x berolinensis]